MNETVKTIVTIACSAGVLGFIEFLITFVSGKFDKNKQLEKKIDDGLAEREAKGKERYDEHHEAIEELRQAITSVAESTQEIHKYNQAVGELVVGLGQDKLVYLTDKYRERGGITLKEKAGLQAIYTPYHIKLNGNGYGEMGFNYCMNELPVISDEQAIEYDKKKMSLKN